MSVGVLPVAIHPHVHVYAGVTGNALPADIALFLASGADQVLLKPLNKAQFVAALLSFITAVIDPSDGRNETKSSDLKAKLPPERVVVAAGDSAGKCSDGLRFLIVVRWLSAGRSSRFHLLLIYYYHNYYYNRYF